MNLAFNLLLFLATFALMEWVAWFTHKYIMHGWLWSLHRDHHTGENPGFFQRNDLFFLLFAIPGIALIYVGVQHGGMDPRLWMGAGISFYGFAYLFVHDVFIHQRVRLGQRTNNAYLVALRKAHRMHHKHLGAENGECFGMLWAPPKYIREARNKA